MTAKYADALRVALDTATQAREAFDAVDGCGDVDKWTRAFNVAEDAELAVCAILTPKGPELLRLIEAVTDAMPELDVPCRDACIHFDCHAIRGMGDALAALDGGEPDAS
jgi:hypothetical protein